MENKRYNILDNEGNIIVGDLTHEEVQRFIQTYSTDHGYFDIEEIHEKDSTQSPD